MIKKSRVKIFGLVLICFAFLGIYNLEAQTFEPPALLGCQYTGGFQECAWGEWVIVVGCRPNPLGNNCTIGAIPDPVEPN